jgi:hypothetical protein
MVKDNRNFDPTKQVLWRVFDAMLVRQLIPDIEVIVERGDVYEFSDWLNREVPESWLDVKEIPYQVDGRDEVDLAAGRLLYDGGFISDTVASVFYWRRHRRRLLAKAKLIRDEAERLRTAQASQRRSPREVA